MDDAKLERLIHQCKSNDVDVKVDALSKLQAEFEAGIEINDPDSVINVLKTCLRTSNQHLTTATVSVLPQLLPLLVARSGIQAHALPSSASPSASTSSTAQKSMVDIVILRQVLTAFLPQGGVIERLGDKEKAQLKARETLVVLGGLAFRSGATSSMSSKSNAGKGPETPLMIFERFLREGGLMSKVWKVREQSILVLVHIRRVHHLFPIRPYLPLLVEALEDTDAHVRDCCRRSVIELFTGPGVTDAARADLKKELTKKGVRKTIVDGVLASILGGGGGSNPQSEGSENGDAKPKDYIPPSLALQGRKPTAASTAGISRTISLGNVKDSSRPSSRAGGPSPPAPPPGGETVEIQPVYIASSRDLENEFADMLKPFEGKESEHNWAARERAIVRVRGMLKGDVHNRYTDAFLACLKEGFIQWSLKALASLRTTVSVHACSLYSELALALFTNLDPFCDTLLTNLLRMANFTKKIAAQQSQISVTTIITHTSAQPRIVLPLLWNTLQEKTVQARAFVVGHVKNYLEIHGHRSKHSIESSGGLEILEKCMKKALADPNPAVRESARVCFWVFEDVWRDRGLAIIETLDPLARKQLEKVCPNPELAAVLPPVTPKTTKKSSIAAAIAASRAKAKAIATAPPSLRHQATSTSHAVRATSPPLKRAGSPSTSPKLTTNRSSSPLRSPTSPSLSLKSRVVSGGPSRSVSTTAVPISHSRSSSGSTRATSPSSPTTESTFRRRTSSPLASTTASSPSRSSTMRQALQTALPASPTSPSVMHSTPTPRGNTNRSAVPIPPRPSTSFSMLGGEDSLLLATAIPIPDSDSDMDESVNLMSFSAPFEMYPPDPPKSDSQAPSFSPNGASNALSTNSNSIPDVTPQNQPIVEDALRYRAEQAESAAERLLELVEPEDEITQHAIPSSLLVGSTTVTPKVKPKISPIPPVHAAPPTTPLNKASAIMRQAALFQDSPAPNGGPLLLDVLRDRKNDSGWWLKRATFVAPVAPIKASDPAERVQELQDCISALDKSTADKQVLQKLVLLCRANPVHEPSSPIGPDFGSPTSPSPFVDSSRSLLSLQSVMWDKDKNFERLFKGLMQYLNPSKGEEELESGLFLLWEILENQAPYIEGREAGIFYALLDVRYCNKLHVLDATNTIRDALTTRIEPVYGLTTMHASLRAFYLQPEPAFSSAEIKATTYAFGLIALGKFILRLPAEIAEEELPRLKGTLISALNDKSSLVIREAAAVSIIAAQLVLRDETHLFTLLDGLADEKKNLLTYLFDKHGARGLAAATGPSGAEKLEKEMRRLDTRLSTPPRPGAAG